MQVHKALFLFLLLITGASTFAQSTDSLYSSCVPKPDTLDGQKVYIVADKLPEFPGGTGEMLSYIRKNLKYPPTQEDLQGTIYLTCVIDTAGRIRNACLIKKLVPGMTTAIEAEALRVVSSMPAWTPGEEKGRRIPVRTFIPIKINIK